MGSWIMLKINLKADNLLEFFINNSSLENNIIKMYVADEFNIATIFIADYFGYAEPVEFYKQNKHIVDDIWWLDISCSNDLIGKNMVDKWYSAKKEYLELKKGRGKNE